MVLKNPLLLVALAITGTVAAWGAVLGALGLVMILSDSIDAVKAIIAGSPAAAAGLPPEGLETGTRPMTAAALIDTLENTGVFLFIRWLIYLWLKPDPDEGEPDDPTT